MQKACLKKADEKKQFFNKIREFQMYFDNLCNKIQRREKIRHVLAVVSEVLRKAPYEYEQIISLNIAVQSKVIGSLRALFYMNQQFKSEFIARFEAEINEGSMNDYKVFLENLKKTKIDFYSLGLMNAKDFSNLFGFNNPLIKPKSPMNSSKQSSFRPYLSVISSHQKPSNDGPNHVAQRLYSAYRINKSMISAKNRITSRERSSINKEKSHDSNSRQQESSRNLSSHKVSQRFNESMDISNARIVAENQEPLIKRNPFFYKLKEKANQPSITLHQIEELESSSNGQGNKGQVSKIMASMTKVTPSQVNPERKSKYGGFYKRKKAEDKARPASKSMFSRNNLDEPISNSPFQRSPQRKTPTNLLINQPLKFDYKIFSILEGYSSDHVQFLTGQILVHIFLELLNAQGHQMFDCLATTYTTLEEEVDSKFSDYYYLRHLSIIKNAYLRKLLKQAQKTDSLQLVQVESDDETCESEFYHQKLQKLTKVTTENLKAISRVNESHELIIKACDCAANLSTVNKLDYQIMLIDKIAAEKKMLNEKNLVMDRIARLQADLDDTRLVCCPPSDDRRMCLAANFIDIPRKICCQIVDQITLYGTFIEKSFLQNCQENCAFELLEFDKRIHTKILLQIDINCQIYQQKLNILQKFLTSIENIFSPPTRIGVSSLGINPRKYRERLIYNIQRHADPEQVLKNRHRKEKFATIMKGNQSFDKTRSVNDNLSTISQSKENLTNLGLRFLRNTTQDNEFVRTHFKGFFKETKDERPTSTRRSTLSKNRVINRIDKNLKIMSQEMNLTFQMLQKLKDGELSRPDQDHAEEDQTTRQGVFQLPRGRITARGFIYYQLLTKPKVTLGRIISKL
jgi:hypothetical protein